MNTPAPVIISEEDQQAFNKLAADFSVNVLADNVHEYEYPYKIDPSSIISSVIDLGFFSINLPSEYGGLGLGFQPLAEILVKISLVDAGLSGTLFANTAALEIVSVASALSSCANIYDILSQANALPLAFQAYSSPDDTTVPVASKRDGNYYLTGRTDLLVSGGTASYAVLPAKSNNGSYSYFLVNLKDKEITKSKPVVTIGMQSCMPVDTELSGARGILVGKEGEGKLLFEEVSRSMSYAVCGILLGIMKGSFNMALEYCSQRYQGGRMIIGWSDMRMKLAGMGTLITLAETCLCGLKSMFASGSVEAGTSALAAAVQIGNISSAVTSEGVQALGGNGYMKDYGQEKRMRDAKQAQSLLGSSLLRKKRVIDDIIREKIEA
jgi:alkylation response protein AidB-like acyl-CoA dehydrogenase